MLGGNGSVMPQGPGLARDHCVGICSLFFCFCVVVFLLLPLTNSERWYLFIAPLTTTCSYVSLFNIFPLFVTWQVAVSCCAASGFACVIACCRFPLENYLWLKLETIRTAQQCSKVLGSRINCLQGCESFRATTYSSNSVTCIPCQNGWRHLSAVKQQTSEEDDAEPKMETVCCVGIQLLAQERGTCSHMQISSRLLLFVITGQTSVGMIMGYGTNLSLWAVFDIQSWVAYCKCCHQCVFCHLHSMCYTVQRSMWQTL